MVAPIAYLVLVLLLLLALTGSMTGAAPAYIPQNVPPPLAAAEAVEAAATAWVQVSAEVVVPSSASAAV